MNNSRTLQKSKDQLQNLELVFDLGVFFLSTLNEKLSLDLKTDFLFQMKELESKASGLLTVIQNEIEFQEKNKKG